MKPLVTPILRLAILLSPDSVEEFGDDSYFSRGFVDDLVTELSRFACLGVISPHSFFSSRFQSMSDPEVAADLMADLLFKIGVRKRQEKVRINAQLVDPGSRGVLWAERYDSPEEEVFAVLDSLVEKIVAALSVQIDAATLSAARRKPITELEAYDCWLRGLEKLQQGSLQTDEEAREFFERALEVDPHCARAYVGLSLSHFNEWSCQNWDICEISECRSFQYAIRALQLDYRDHVAHLVAGRIYLYRSEMEKAEKHIDLAFELNPNDADHLVQIATCKGFLGDLDTASKIFDRALALNPYCEPSYYAYGGWIQIMRKDFEEGITMALKAPLTSVWIDLPGYIALAYGYSGNAEEAGVYTRIFLEAFQEKILQGRTPESGEALEWLVNVNPFRRAEDSEFFRKGLVLAGFSESTASESDEIHPIENTVQRATSGRVFRALNDLRYIAFEGKEVQLPEVKGFGDIERLLESGSEEIHCTELMGTIAESGESSEVLDSRARGECAARIRELQAELHEAEEFNDFTRAEKVAEELDPLIDFLAKSVGIGGRSRRLAAPSERARSAVTWRIRSAIGKIEAVHPPLARHLTHSIRTGTFCTYAPEKPLKWEV
ncbi:MAG: hypothetical protein P1V20_09165 [Verrucomicrobiales bacterium]|nr:hypothetical protein [Verrucomicrobiales bacterium]